MSRPEDSSPKLKGPIANLVYDARVRDISPGVQRQRTESRSTGSKSGTFSETVFAKAEESGNHIRKHYIEDHHKTQCSFYNEDGPVEEDIVDVRKLVARIESSYQSELDSICIIEDIDAQWIQTLGTVSHLQMHSDFFVQHLIGYEYEATRSQIFSDKIAKVSVTLDDLAEETAFAYTRHNHSEPDPAQVSYPLPLKLLSFLNNMLPRLKAYIDGLG
nr:hypothetical protein B0A51_02733 [Rachicladosporium sp. CCFEE 5018]OQO30103.1 hypothetical protein B0A51_02665 [Rachicladosporium sp. CCFEE 5018]OQO30526.1 hypothetical protein B0A51_02375 [Rachicladosporium sp. CCFEE 5018]